MGNENWQEAEKAANEIRSLCSSGPYTAPEVVGSTLTAIANRLNTIARALGIKVGGSK